MSQSTTADKKDDETDQSAQYLYALWLIQVRMECYKTKISHGYHWRAPHDTFFKKLLNHLKTTEGDFTTKLGVPLFCKLENITYNYACQMGEHLYKLNSWSALHNLTSINNSKIIFFEHKHFAKRCSFFSKPAGLLLLF